jgi:hypothetical protein
VASERRLDLILDAAARGKTFTPAELLGMQATVFRYSRSVEVLSRATDRLVGTVKHAGLDPRGAFGYTTRYQSDETFGGERGGTGWRRRGRRRD